MFATVSGSDQPLPVCAIGFLSLAFVRSGALGTWLRDHPDGFDALSRGENVVITHGRPSTRVDQSFHLIPVRENAILQGSVLLPLSDTGDSQINISLLSGLGTELLQTVGQREDLEMENRELRCLVDNLVKQTAALAEQQQQMDSAFQAQARSRSSAVHDVRNRLVAVRGYARMLLHRGAELSEQKRRDYLAVILENANHIVRLIDDLASSITSHPLRLEALDILELWRECLSLIRPQASRKSITFVEHLPADRVMINGDRERLTFVLHKLLSVTVKLAEFGGRVDAEILHGVDQIAVYIRDPGQGVPLEFAKRTFGCCHDPAEKDPERVTAEMGSVSLVHDIVHMHRGRLSVTGSTGEGWSLILALPLLQDQESLEAHVKAQRSSS